MEGSPVELAVIRLQTLAAANPRMSDVATTYQQLITAQSAASARVPPIGIPAAILQERRKTGIPLLAGEEINIRPEECHEFFLSISRSISCVPDSTGKFGTRNQQLNAIIGHVESGALDPITLLSDDRILENRSAQLGLDPALLQLLAKYTLKTFLHAWRAEVEKQVDLEVSGSQRSCPFCGSPPTLAEVQGVERSRYLRCLQCGARWSYPNLTCAFCGNTDHTALGILQLVDEGHKYFTHTCDICRSYIKTVVTFAPIPQELLLAEDLATLHLDNLARGKGYHAGE